jgi:tetratricopeptide (TPR) repeat protein
MRDAAERLRICREVTERDPGAPVAWLALAGAYREQQDLRAREALERAATAAPDWEAVHYELGKLWLALDDLRRARDSFQRAGDLMPTFSAAFSNLGATLGELDEPDAALAAFRQALAHDPRGHTILSNIGVVSRELGKLDESEAALRQVTTLAPDFVFGHYNLGHTLFLAGRYPDAIAAYAEGARRDPQKNPRQLCRLAMARFAAGDVGSAERDLWAAVNSAPADEREDLLLEACEIAHALRSAHPDHPAQQAFAERLAAEIAKSE